MDSLDLENFGEILDEFTFPFNENDTVGTSNEPVSIDDMIIFEDLINLNELVEMMSNENSPNNSEILDASLDNVPLTEIPASNLLEIVPDNIPQDKLMLLKVPEEFQEDNILQEMLDVEVDESLLNSIDEALQGTDSALLNKQLKLNVEIPENNQTEVVRRRPLQLVQNVLDFPVTKRPRILKKVYGTEGKKKEPTKRKQHFYYPREDRVEFYSDDDTENQGNENCKNSISYLKKTDETTTTMSAKRPRIGVANSDKISDMIRSVEEEVSKNQKKKKVSTPGTDKCPQCNKAFKKLIMHKCKKVIPASSNSQIPKLRPSDVPLPSKCTTCKKYFKDVKALEEHQDEKHSQKVCKNCKFVAKNVGGLKVHMLKCGIVKSEKVAKPVIIEADK